MPTQHISVLKDEIIKYLNLKKGDYAIDATLGGGGHAAALAEIVGKKGLVIAIDQDAKAIELFEKDNKNKYKNIKLINDNFSHLQLIINRIFKEKKTPRFNGIVFDLGLSSDQLADRTRGFSFQSDGPLNMNFDPAAEPDQTAEYILYNYSEIDLAQILKNYGEVENARNIARAIIEYRAQDKIKNTKQLIEIIERFSKTRGKRKINPAAMVFQALRIAVNKELNSLESALPQAVDLLGQGGRIAVISFHSLEDRIVKNYFRTESKDCLCPPAFPICRCGHRAKLKIINKKPIIAGEKEIENNTRARSAKLRVAEKI